MKGKDATARLVDGRFEKGSTEKGNDGGQE